MQGSTFKRIGLLQAALKDNGKANAALQAALSAYRKAMNEWVTDGARFNWTASQYLALNAVLKKKPDTGDFGTYAVCRRLAERDLDNPDQGTSDVGARHARRAGAFELVLSSRATR